MSVFFKWCLYTTWKHEAKQGQRKLNLLSVAMCIIGLHLIWISLFYIVAMRVAPSVFYGIRLSCLLVCDTMVTHWDIRKALQWPNQTWSSLERHLYCMWRYSGLSLWSFMFNIINVCYTYSMLTLVLVS